jgi:uncharacterized protein
MAIDPGFRTGCKVVVLDKFGHLKENTAIYPHPPQVEVFQANKTIKELADKYKVEAVAIGNGTAGRETENFVRHIDFKEKPLIVVVNEKTEHRSIRPSEKSLAKNFPITTSPSVVPF